jgi:serine/threonine protein phosphatase PrpC
MLYNTNIIHASAIGNTHIKKGTPNQDSVHHWISDNNNFWIVALSDGHGSSSHYFSDVGSQNATKVAVQLYKESYCEALNVSESQFDIKQDLKKYFNEFYRLWSDACQLHHCQYHAEKSDSKSEVNFSLRPYGCTICIAFTIRDSIAILNVGDSTVHIRNQSGFYSNFLVHDEAIGEVTDSLCSSNAIELLQLNILPKFSGLLLLSTDGVIKSLPNADDYPKIANYYFGLFESGATNVDLHKDLHEQLQNFAVHGSGDDSTMALVYIAHQSETITFPNNRSIMPYSCLLSERVKLPIISIKRGNAIFAIVLGSAVLFVTSIIIRERVTFRHSLNSISASFCTVLNRLSTPNHCHFLIKGQ